jgi:hypothetical protein
MRSKMSDHQFQCPGAPRMDHLEAKFDLLCGKIDNLIDAIQFYKWIIKALLFVVCVIALGSKLLESLPAASKAFAIEVSASK